MLRYALFCASRKCRYDGLQVTAEWSMYSKFLKMLGIPLHGKVEGTVTGFTSDVAVEVRQLQLQLGYSPDCSHAPVVSGPRIVSPLFQVTKSNELVMHQCIARFRDFDIHLSGSLAAEILHWFHKMLSNAMQSRVEQVHWNADLYPTTQGLRPTAG